MTHPTHRFCAAIVATLLQVAPVVGQAPPPSPPPAAPVQPAPQQPHATPEQKRAQALVDEFIAVMPQDPKQLRNPELRKPLAQKALPVLRRICTYFAANAHSEFAARSQEFVIYALVLDDPTLREELVARGKTGDREADLLVRTAEVIQAVDGERRGKAIAACAVAMRSHAATGEKALDANVAASAVQCLATAADLSEAEAKQLANAGIAEDLAKRLRMLAEMAARDPRRLLDKPFTLDSKALGGESFVTRSLLGKVVVIDFWATWCGPCVRSLPDLVRLRQEHGDGLAIVGISCDNDETKLRKFLAEHPEVDWPQLFTAGDKPWHPLATEYGIESIPRLFLVDRKGVLRSVDAKQDLEALIRRYLAE